jgi:hypothetical protein
VKTKAWDLRSAEPTILNCLRVKDLFNEGMGDASRPLAHSILSSVINWQEEVSLSVILSLSIFPLDALLTDAASLFALSFVLASCRVIQPLAVRALSALLSHLLSTVYHLDTVVWVSSLRRFSLEGYVRVDPIAFNALQVCVRRGRGVVGWGWVAQQHIHVMNHIMSTSPRASTNTMSPFCFAVLLVFVFVSSSRRCSARRSTRT